jgi:hypothetical protein
MSAALNEHPQDVKDLRRQRHRMTVSQQHVFRHIQAKGPELVARPALANHHPSGKGTAGGNLGAFSELFARTTGGFPRYLLMPHTAEGDSYDIPLAKRDDS